jgi:hypothetical protein
MFFSYFSSGMLVVIAAACFNFPGLLPCVGIYFLNDVCICTSTSRLERPQENDVPERGCGCTIEAAVVQQY